MSVGKREKTLLTAEITSQTESQLDAWKGSTIVIVKPSQKKCGPIQGLV